MPVSAPVLAELSTTSTSTWASSISSNVGFGGVSGGVAVSPGRSSGAGNARGELTSMSPLTKSGPAISTVRWSVTGSTGTSRPVSTHGKVFVAPGVRSQREGTWPPTRNVSLPRPP